MLLDGNNPQCGQVIQDLQCQRVTAYMSVVREDRHTFAPAGLNAASLVAYRPSASPPKTMLSALVCIPKIQEVLRVLDPSSTLRLPASRVVGQPKQFAMGRR